MSRVKNTPSHKQLLFKAMQTSFPFTDFKTECMNKELVYNPTTKHARIRTKTTDNNGNYVDTPSLPKSPRILRKPIYRADWSYRGSNGPENWHLHYPVAACDYQSPINIEKRRVKTDPALKEITFTGYDVEYRNLKIFNDGYTVKVRLNEEATVQIKDQPNVYSAFEIRFHWGSSNEKGSEHTNDGDVYPMEVQIYHRNTKYSSDEMYEKQDGLLVLAFWAQISSDGNPGFTSIVDSLDKIAFQGEENTISSLMLESLLPNDRRFYFQYIGSLTTPPCNECVSWVVFSETISISNEQINKFRSLSSSPIDRNDKLVDNFRPPQNIRRRVVKASAEMPIEFD